MKKFIFIIFCFLLGGCATGDRASKDRPLVVVSLPPYEYFVERIAGGFVDVKSAIPSGANPHLFESTPKQIQAIEDADLWIGTGDPYERKLLQVLKEHNPKLITLNLSEGLKLPSSLHSCGHSHERDLHIWTNPMLVIPQVEEISREIVKLVPRDVEEIEANTNNLIADLRDLDEKIRKILKPFVGRAIIVSHPSLEYFCREYGLVQVSVECEGKSPLPKDLQALFEKAEKYGAICVITEPQFDNTGAEIIAKELDLPIFMFDNLATDYNKNLIQLAEMIANAK